MNRRNFLKVTGVTAAGVTVPFLFVPENKIEETLKPVKKIKVIPKFLELTLQFKTSKGDLYFKHPEGLSSNEDGISFSASSFTIIAEETMTIFSVTVHLPDLGLVTDIPISSPNIRTSDTVTFTPLTVNFT